MPQQMPVPLIALSILSLIVVASSPVNADPAKGHGHGKHQQQQQVEQNDDSREVNAQLSVQVGGVTLTVGTARELASTYQVSKAKPLPLGIRKQLAQGKALPTGIAKQRLPANYVQQLPVREGCEWNQVGSDLVLVAVATGIVVELLNDVF